MQEQHANFVLLGIAYKVTKVVYMQILHLEPQKTLEFGVFWPQKALENSDEMSIWHLLHWKFYAYFFDFRCYAGIQAVFVIFYVVC